MEVQINKEYIAIECCECGTIFAISLVFRNHLRETKQDFYCPNGHCQAFKESLSDILKKDIENKDSEIRTLELTIKELEKPKLKRKKKTTKK